MGAHSYFLALVPLALAAAPAFAIEQKEIRVADKWAVVGVIAGTDPKGHDVGIAVLRNTQSKHTYTLAIGDAVPNEFGYVLKAVQNRHVIIADGNQQVTLGFAEATASPSGSEDERENRTARFIDNYYRGFGDSPVEIFKTDRSRDDAAIDSEGSARDGLGKTPLRRFGNYKDDAARSRFDLYSNDGANADGGSRSSDQESDSGFLVNYPDNFQDDERDVATSASPTEPPGFDAGLLRDAIPSDGLSE